MSSRKPKTVVSAHKVGSTWLVKMLCEYYHSILEVVPPLYRQVRSIPGLVDLGAKDVNAYVSSLSGDSVLKSHCYPPPDDSNVWQSVNVIYIYRDPRDIAVSNAFYLAKLSPDKGGWERLGSLTAEARIIKYLEESYHDLRLLEFWQDNKKSIKVSYEDMLQNPREQLSRILQLCDNCLDGDRVDRSVEACSFDKLSGGRMRGDSCDQSFFRKGISGDWKNYFSSEVVDCFKSCQSGRWYRMLNSLGYADFEAQDLC